VSDAIAVATSTSCASGITVRATLEDQAKGPVVNLLEMGMGKLEDAMARVRALPGYANHFKKAFPNDKDPMTVDNAAKAVAACERTLITPDSPYDRFVKGDKKALTAQQQRGMRAFADLGCVACRSGPAFNGPTGLAVGQGFYAKFPTFAGSAYDRKYALTADPGRFEVTKNEADRHMFRVPTLRNINMTAPYFHNGAVGTLDEAVRVMAKTQLNQDLSDAQVQDLVAFLNGLTGEFPAQTMPRLPALPGGTLLK
jgi:cytochrome c peroxidase